METVFRSFCSFGADKGATPQMDGMKLVKLCRDLKLLDKNLTATDVDIVYSKVKPKSERKINFKQFEEALKMIADKKFPATEGALEKLKAMILEGGGPVAHRVKKAVKLGVVERLTDGSKVASGAPSTKKGATDVSSSSSVGGKGGKAPISGGSVKPHPPHPSGKSTNSTNGKVEGAAGTIPVVGKAAKEVKSGPDQTTLDPERKVADGASAPPQYDDEKTGAPPGNGTGKTSSKGADEDSSDAGAKLTHASDEQGIEAK